MCGFLGEFTYKNELSDSQKFEELLSLSHHRGPDSTKVVIEEKYMLGFNRLALLDLSLAGEQPAKSPSQRYHVMFNGEIYNYKELIVRYGLKNLRSTADTEVLLHLFDAIGVIDTLKALNGMFAIAVIDNIENQLFLTRDFAGIKPLFYGKKDRGIVFASQFDQIYKHDWFIKQLTLRGELIHEFFAFGYMQAPNTVFQNIFQINPGECLKIDSKGQIYFYEIYKYPKTSKTVEQYNLESVEKILENATKLQMNTDRSLASFLSGGIDSTLITSLAGHLDNSIEAFTLEVEDDRINESHYAKTYANHLKIKHKIVKVDKSELIKIIDEHFDSFPEPFGDFSSIPTYMVTKKAAVFHTAMLSGDGGDELFWGYPRMYDILKKAWWFKIPFHLRTNLARIGNKLGLTNTYAPYHRNLESFWLNKHSKLPETLLANVFNNSFSKELNQLYEMETPYTKKSLQQFLRWNEFYGHLQRVLIKVDRTSMRNSLEVRVPFLDKHVIDKSWMIYFSINSLIDLKQPLKKLASQIIPSNLLMQKKQGFSVPINKWFRNQLKEDLIKTVLDSDLYGNEHFDQTILKGYVQSFLEGKHNNGWGVWHIYAWQKWAEKFILK